LHNKNIKVYTIWIWSKKAIWNFAPLNERVLKKISYITNWKFFRAIDNDSFEKIFKNLENLEKNDIIVKEIKISSWSYKFFYLIFLFSLFLFFIIEGKKH
jgi:hypothetical protein